MTTSTSASRSQRLSSRAAPFVMEAEAKHTTSQCAHPPAQAQPQQPAEAVEEEAKSVEPPAAAAKAPRQVPNQRKKNAAAKAAAAAVAALSLDASAGQPLAATPAPLPAVRATTPCVVRMLLGKQAAAHVIGHGGGAIESVRAAAAAALHETGGECPLPFVLDLEQARSIHTRRIATLQGALVQVQRALECMLDVLLEKRALGAASAAAAKLAAMAPGERPPPPKRQPGDQVAITFIIPNPQLGAVIGVGGATIAMVRERSAAILRVSEDNLERSQEKSLQIVGQRTAVQYAAWAVAELLCQAQLAGMPASSQPYVLDPPMRPGQQAALAALAAPVPPHPHPHAQHAAAAQQPSPAQSSMPSMQPILQPLAPPPLAPPHPPPPPVLMPMHMHPPHHPHAHPMSFNPVVAQLHEVTLRLQQLGIQSAHQSLYGLVNNRQLHASQMEIHQLQHVYSMLQAQLHQQSAAAAAAAAATAMAQQQHMPQMLPPHMQPQPLVMPMPGGPSPFFHAPAGVLGAALDRAHNVGTARNPVVLSLSIPASLMGGLIGKKGERIQAIRVASEARIKIDSAAESAQRIAAELETGVQSTARGRATQHPLPRVSCVAPLSPSPAPSDDGGDRKEREEEVAAADEGDEEAAQNEDDQSKPLAAPADPATPAPQSVSSPDRVLTLTGTHRQVELAAQLIMEILDSMQQGSSSGSRRSKTNRQANGETSTQPQHRQHTDEPQQPPPPPQPQSAPPQLQPEPQLPGPDSNVSPVSSR